MYIHDSIKVVFHGMEEVVGSIPTRSTNCLQISDIRIVNGNLKEEIDRFHGRTLQAIHSRKAVSSQRFSAHG